MCLTNTSRKEKGGYIMLKDFLWKTFEYTGNIENYMFFKELSDFENKNVKDKKSNESVPDLDNTTT